MSGNPSNRAPNGRHAKVGIDPDRLHLMIARDALERFNAVQEPVDGGGIVFTPAIENKPPTAHFQWGAICITFSGFAVQYGLERLVALRSELFIRKDRQPLAVTLSKRPRRKELSEFLRQATKLPETTDADILRVLGGRDRFAHAEIIKRPDKVVREAVLPGQRPEIQRSLHFSRITWTDVRDAHKIFNIAERLVEALRREIVNDEWEPGLPMRRPQRDRQDDAQGMAEVAT